jgi:hypothetical protein
MGTQHVGIILFIICSFLGFRWDMLHSFYVCYPTATTRRFNNGLCSRVVNCLLKMKRLREPCLHTRPYCVQSHGYGQLRPLRYKGLQCGTGYRQLVSPQIQGYSLGQPTDSRCPLRYRCTVWDSLQTAGVPSGTAVQSETAYRQPVSPQRHLVETASQ